MTPEACGTSPGFPVLHLLPEPALLSVFQGFSEALPPESETRAAAQPQYVSMPTSCPQLAAGSFSSPPARVRKRPEPGDRQTGVKVSIKVENT